MYDVNIKTLEYFWIFYIQLVSNSSYPYSNLIKYTRTSLLHPDIYDPRQITVVSIKPLSLQIYRRQRDEIN